MGFIKNALIGIVLYETGKYFLKHRNSFFCEHSYDLGSGPGNDPRATFSGYDQDKDDPWKNSLADDELRAPDA